MEIYRNCRIITMDEELPNGDYMVVNSGRVVEIGRGIIKPEYEDAKQVDLKGGVIVPGFWESHLHIATGMRSLMELNLRDCSDSKQLRERVNAYCSKIAPGDWVIGHGWDERKFFGGKFPDRYVLDEFCNSHPMVLVRMDGHSLCVNTAAIEHLGLQGLESSPEAPQGADGKPSGMFFESTASDILASIECLFPDNYIEKVILSAQDLFFKNGITSVNDISIQYGRYLELYRK
jgi:predicted amidohydrolase YtcJ